jgi:phosphoribosylformylglycinamidine (FGAM) synthase PurS component
MTNSKFIFVLGYQKPEEGRNGQMHNIKFEADDQQQATEIVENLCRSNGWVSAGCYLSGRTIPNA